MRATIRRSAVLAILAGAITTPAVLGIGVSAASATVSPPSVPWTSDPANCTPSAAHPDPVVLLHGLGANDQEDVNGYYQQSYQQYYPYASIQGYLADHGFCTYSLTYGAWAPSFGYVGGAQDVSVSAGQIAQFIQYVQHVTGASKVDLVGHSEGGIMSILVPKEEAGIAADVANVVAIAPPTHGTSFSNLATLATDVVGQPTFQQIGSTFGWPILGELEPTSPQIRTLDSPPIAQPGIHYNVITSQQDEMVTPTTTSFVNEPGVNNQYIQNYCPYDYAGHIGEAYDPNIQTFVGHALDPSIALPNASTCTAYPNYG